MMSLVKYAGTFLFCLQTVGCGSRKAQSLPGVLPAQMTVVPGPTDGATAPIDAKTSNTVPNCTSDGQINCIATEKFRAVDTSLLVPANLKNGVKIAGITGNYPSLLNPLPESALGTDLPNLSGTLSAGTYQFWKSDGTRASGIVSDAGTISALSSTQSFSTSLYRSFSVSALTLPLSSQLCAGETVQGVSGSRICLPLSAVGTFAGASDILAGKVAYNASGILVMGTMPSNGTWNLALGSHAAGYYSGAVSNAPNASDMASTLTVNGVTGNLGLDFQSALNSGMFRPKSVSPFSLKQEKQNDIAARLMDGIFSVAQIANDKVGGINDNSNMSTLTNRVTRSADSASWGDATTRKVCGQGAATLALKIADCEAKNGSVTPWDGATNGNGPEGSWTLVTVAGVSLTDGDVCTSACKEVWRDDRTGLVWSDKLHNGGTDTPNWCHASGSSGGPAGNPFKETDPNNICDNTANQSQTSPVSWCVEHSSLTTSSVLSDGKGFLSLTSTPAVVWRLPTKNDWMLAEYNGLLRVLPNLGNYFWTATISERSSSQVYYYSTTRGEITAEDGNFNGGRSNVGYSRVRCIGAPL